MDIFRKLINFAEWGKISGKNSGSLRALAHGSENGRINLDNSKTWNEALIKLKEHLYKEILSDPFDRLTFLGMASFVVDLELGQVLRYDFQSSTLYLDQRGKSAVEIKKGSPLAANLVHSLFA